MHGAPAVEDQAYGAAVGGGLIGSVEESSDGGTFESQLFELAVEGVAVRGRVGSERRRHSCADRGEPGMSGQTAL